MWLNSSKRLLAASTIDGQQSQQAGVSSRVWKKSVIGDIELQYVRHHKPRIAGHLAWLTSRFAHTTISNF